MRKIEQMKIVDVHTHTICNKCEKEVPVIVDETNYHIVNLIYNFSTPFEYGSSFDNECWEFDLCEDCLLEFVRTFKIMPTNFSNRAKYPEEVFKDWQQTGVVDYKAGWTEDDYKKAEESKKILRKSINEMLTELVPKMMDDKFVEVRKGI